MACSEQTTAVSIEAHLRASSLKPEGRDLNTEPRTRSETQLPNSRGVSPSGVRGEGAAAFWSLSKPPQTTRTTRTKTGGQGRQGRGSGLGVRVFASHLCSAYENSCGTLGIPSLYSSVNKGVRCSLSPLGTKI